MKKAFQLFLLSIFFFLMTGTAYQLLAQDSSGNKEEAFIRKSSFIVLPIIYYTPETRFAFGGASLYAFRWQGQSDTLRPSQLQLGFAYTQENQILSYLPFQFFFDEENWQIKGELGYYRYVYQFFGVGNNTLESNKEAYDVTFPRLRLDVMKKIAPYQYAGLRYWMDDYNITKVEEGGFLDERRFTGADGGFVSGAGLIWNYDSRNMIFFPSKGYFIQAQGFFNRKELGSDFNFTRLGFDAAAYFSKGEKNIFAFNLVNTYTFGNPPFQELAFLGGAKKMRGYFEGRLRDNHNWIAQAEYRRIIWKWIGINLFSAAGAVGNQPSDLFKNQVHFTYGAGLRFTIGKKDHVNLGLDYAGNEQGEFFPYLTVGEAF
ncbi:MAG: BamA/TamA family outer membrane protein [Saprospiraceae bacterium]